MMAAAKKQILTVGTRTSRLALWQTEHVIGLLKHAWPVLDCRTRTYVTEGDQITDTPLPEFGGKGVFTTLLERALNTREIDIAVHSLKDLPTAEDGGLVVGAVTTRANTRDGLVARNNWTLATLPTGAVVGTSSIRRQAQLLAVRPDLTIRSIRGNVDTRIRKVREGQYDATVLAAAGLKRLGLTEHVTEWLPLETMLPAPGQGALAVQCRADDAETMNLLAAIDDAEVRGGVTAERRFSPHPRDSVRVEGTGDGGELGGRLAREAIELGAGVILSRVKDTDGQNAALGERAPSRRSEPGTTGKIARNPLQGRRIVVTRAKHQAKALADPLSELGATTLLMPAIRIAPAEDLAPLDHAIRSLGEYDWVILTSANAVEIVWDRLAANDLSSSIFDHVRIAAVGSSTAKALTKRGVEPTFVPEEFVGESIANGIGDVRGQRVLLARARIARDTLPKMLEEHGAKVEDIPVYDTLPVDFDDHQLAELKKGIDVITFTSGSTVRNFLAAIRAHTPAIELSDRTLIACIGPVTARAARELGLRVDVVPTEYTTDGLVHSLVQHFQEGQT
jgi:hydroxymethylbilane synthase